MILETDRVENGFLYSHKPIVQTKKAGLCDSHRWLFVSVTVGVATMCALPLISMWGILSFCQLCLQWGGVGGHSILLSLGNGIGHSQKGV